MPSGGGLVVCRLLLHSFATANSLGNTVRGVKCLGDLNFGTIRLVPIRRFSNGSD